MDKASKEEIVKSMRNRTTKLDREGDYWEEHEKETLKHYKCRCATCKAPRDTCPLCKNYLAAQEVE